jgi:hypothetical protein
MDGFFRIIGWGGGQGVCYFHERRLEVWIKMQVVAFPVLNVLDMVLAYRVFGQSALKNLRVKIATAVI